MAEAAVIFLLDNLKQLTLHNYNLISNANNELKLLQNELMVMKSFLESVSNNKKEEHFKAWEGQIREIVYEAEDTIDSCVAQAAAAAKSKNPLKTANRDLAQEVLSLRNNKVKPVFEKALMDFANLPVADPLDSSAEDTRDKRNKLWHAPRKDNVVGFQDETDKLIKFINEETKTLDVVSIIGMPGLGKTTVAWKIFHDQRIQYEFPTRVWVYVSQELNKKDIFLAILKKFTQEDMSSKSIEDMISMIYEYLEKGKFLIVMDDVWTNEAWDELQQVLPKSNGMGKVLMTSRHERVAWHANKRRPPHQLRFLTKPESWELLQLEVFHTVNDFPADLEAVGKQIAHQCYGLPLAIIVIGGILEGKFSIAGGNLAMRKEWEKVAESVDLIHDDKERRVEKMIALSYNQLPYHLRDCFLYLGMFPEDTELLAWKLIQLWIAERFVQQNPNSNKSLEEVAQDNLKDLINRNLVMVDKIKPNGEVKTCRVHDTIREFCKNEASPGKQNLYQEIKMSNQGVFQPPLQLVPKYRRLCIHSYVNEFLQKKIKVPKSRSFLCFSQEPIILDKKDIAPIIEAFTLLRVFEVNTINFPIFPVKVTQLVHLRYIALSCDKLDVLPEAISKLWNLQTLIVDTQSRTIKVNVDIWTLLQLKHLKTKASLILCNNRKGDGGENLQTLGRLSPKSCTNEVFSKGKNINTLGIRGDLDKVLGSESFKMLRRLEKLKLENDVFPGTASENPLHSLPRLDSFPPNLKVLTLSSTFLDWSYMSTLGQINNLEVLKLKNNAFKGKKWKSIAGGFHSLEFLYIARTDLNFWTVQTEAFPTLKTLVLKNCERLESIPLDLGNKLEMLYVERVPRSVADSAREIEKKKQENPGPQRAYIGRFKLIIAPGVETN